VSFEPRYASLCYPTWGSGQLLMRCFASDLAFYFRVASQLCSSPTSESGAASDAVKFVVPMAANGKVYVGSRGMLVKLKVAQYFGNAPTRAPLPERGHSSLLWIAL
jgi:hypothetical protein